MKLPYWVRGWRAEFAHGRLAIVLRIPDYEAYRLDDLEVSRSLVAVAMWYTQGKAATVAFEVEEV